ncbi:MAG TPA: hypothetical protein ENI13_01065 [candidate division CPR3 bacterium]|uniref:Uncharacterized protein n=1 Tax=candidate division CPR3 bacterium TaxID=2268181 RepID=A0A7C1NJQ4_UNCC3|nr:hypothetical protein [candidate division CPR3 bacterium]
MKAIIRRGKHKGREVEISQWCNDWFTVNTGDPMIDRKPFSPTSLAFNVQGLDKIREHKNNGMLFNWFEIVDIRGFGEYFFSFKKRKFV